MHLVVGLGNPGPEYERTPHNAGFLVAEHLGLRNGIRITRPEAKSLVGLGSLGPHEVAIAKPQTFMNLSGAAVKQLMEKYEVPAGNLVVIWDELNLPWGVVKILPKGSAGGHNGATSVIQSLGTQEFCRVRIGVNPGHPLESGVDFLLSPMKRQQLQQMEDAVSVAAEAVETIISEGVEKAMTRFNRRARGENEEV